MGRSRNHDAKDSFDHDLEQDNARRSSREEPEQRDARARNRDKGRWKHSPSDVTDTPQSERPSQRYSNDMTDQDMGYTTPGIPNPVSTALEHKSELDWLRDWDDADLYSLPLYRELRLVEGQVYFDLRDPGSGEFRVDEETLLRGDELILAKNEVPEHLWDRLTNFRDHPEVRAA